MHSDPVSDGIHSGRVRHLPLRLLQQLIIFQRAKNIPRRKQNEAIKHTMNVYITGKTPLTDTAPKGREIKSKGSKS